MKMRFYKFPKWQQWFYPKAIFDLHNDKESIQDKTIYLTFDDGPSPETTIQILDLLDEYNAKATFFCIGENVKTYPDLFLEILNRGHAVGNHSMTHLNGFKTEERNYVLNVLEAGKLIKSNLFRPPFGKCTPMQHRELNKLGFKSVFWTHLTYDFDKLLLQKERFNKIKKLSKPGSIIVFHDTFQSFNRAEFKLILDYYSGMCFNFKALVSEDFKC
jgi:peptidoglycan/xylan/chitin deacetylase (PgdA/CDA1 family)